MRSKERKIRLKNVNPQITCHLCKGYLVNAHTITECLHTFCKSCIVKFLSEKNTCPKCGIIIHQSYPLNYISFDRTMQDIVFKLVPNLQINERVRQQKFYKSQGLAVPQSDSQDDILNKSPASTNTINRDYHKEYDDQINVILESNCPKWKPLKKKFIRCSSQATVTHLKKFIAIKLFKNHERFKDVDLLCNEELLGKDHTLKFVCVTRWRLQNNPLLLHYQPSVDLL